MYIWCGISVDEQLSELKQSIGTLEKQLEYKNSNLTLPLHISMKMSFPISDGIFNSVVDDLSSYFEAAEPFDISVRGIEYEGPIVWVMMVNNDRIDAMHRDICDMLNTKYHVELHEYDMDYKFHTTLFMDPDPEKNLIAFNKIKNCNIPDKLRAGKFVIGCSVTGELGTYKVIREITKKA